jgi:hypothetical protein
MSMTPYVSRGKTTQKIQSKLWMGHASEDVGDLYSKRKDDVAWRQEWAERVGLGFELVHIGPQDTASLESEKVA